MINLPTEVLDYINEYMFKPKTKEELQKAVNLWCTNKDDALNRYGHISNWDTSLINDMSRLFQYSNFNKNINDWDVSNVTDMRGMFEYCFKFNQPLNDNCLSKKNIILHSDTNLENDLDAMFSELILLQSF